uniref:Uncharacterized protein n=1 Tax=Anguilla anguilla TaxID=7936 RepID=A0A0E9WX44_ANGAN
MEVSKRQVAAGVQTHTGCCMRLANKNCTIIYVPFLRLTGIVMLGQKHQQPDQPLSSLKWEDVFRDAPVRVGGA